MGLGRSGLPCGLAMVCLSLGCGSASLAPAPDARAVGPQEASGPVVRLAPTTLLTRADLSSAQTLAADADGIYWIEPTNQLWMLPTGSDTSRQLAVDRSPTNAQGGWACLIVNGGDLFWTSAIFGPQSTAYLQYPLHRTKKTGDDEVLLPNLPCMPGELVADDTHLYFPTGDPSGNVAEIAALPVDADPGTVPVPLATLGLDMNVSSLAVDDRYLYWTTYPSGSTVQVEEGPVTRGDKASLLGGTASFSQLVTDWARALQPFDSGLFFVGGPPGLASSWAVGHVDRSGVRTDLPLPGGATLLVFDDWVITVVGATSVPPGGTIWAAPIGAVTGDGSAGVQIASNVAAWTPPVIGEPGLVFVDDGGHLLAVSKQDLAAAVAAGQP